ncbi:MAG: SRPBCC family protein [Acidobacteriota bacterium]|nr:SRPBCC family protein [Acidobacteriota bacterium]
MIKKGLIVVAVLLLAVLGFAATRPGQMHVERAVIVNAPPERVLPLVSDFHEWGNWSPYEKLDPSMRRAYSGSDRGVGAVYEWDGNGEAGQGRMEVIEVTPARVAIKLDFIRPFEGHNVATFTAAPEGSGTRVVWAMDGPVPYVAKLMSLFMDMDAMIGKDFEAGLVNLKSLAEKPTM